MGRPRRVLWIPICSSLYERVCVQQEREREKEKEQRQRRHMDVRLRGPGGAPRRRERVATTPKPKPKPRPRTACGPGPHPQSQSQSQPQPQAQPCDASSRAQASPRAGHDHHSQHRKEALERRSPVSACLSSANTTDVHYPHAPSAVHPPDPAAWPLATLASPGFRSQLPVPCSPVRGDSNSAVSRRQRVLNARPLIIQTTAPGRG
ncbi:hypothetical protein MPTK1_6g06690 [Marchantia polymorpha subsp. ruderalis]|uniref:Uncharacterized protein n=2 Tax=Marchantia polymorpha TaxID=3197 RepID=A0AAF6BP88_MARPO|nr:hypothetical protein MARPO_0173s0014 [Marchantia polymorpha]BBN13822.1 hypothetical protein Mp_6g06690 [Marchantia polymorpha subsp. ruderalis]|eukprot:PTQ28111.1 hypothetical protein MARPO_0173s0014 [Marchantia polymorpha]